MHKTLLTAATLIFAGGAIADHATPAPQQALQWGPAPPVFAAGAQMAVVSGDPSKAGKFSIQLKMPDGYKIMPHFHPTAEIVEVKSGTFMYGMGDAMKAADMKPLAVGKSVDIAANMHHYAMAKGETIVQVNSTGPFALTYVNPADNPMKTAAAAKPSAGGH